MAITTDPADHQETAPPATPLRALGAFERLYYRYTEHNPMHFLLVAEFGTTLREEDVAASLAAVQRRHPLLSAHVEDRADTRLAFCRAHDAAPVELTVTRADRRTWQQTAARELSRPFDRSRAPLMRAALVLDASGSTVLLTFDHTVADGMSSVAVLNDLVAALNGRPLEPLPLPPSQEEMIARALPPIEDFPVTEPPAADPRMSALGSIRPFDPATPPHVATCELDRTETSRLVRRCRAEGTTVHAALVTAASLARAEGSGEDFVRVVTPFNFRGLIGAGGDCCDYFTATRTGMAPGEIPGFWEQARAVGGELAGARSAAGVVAVSAATRQYIPVDAGTQEAEQFLVGGLAYEMLISNLGVRDLEDSGPVRPDALWGPVLMCQVAGEFVIGVTTYEGRLRMVGCGHAPTETFLADVRDRLRAACA
ncbi:condensation domain-containing protein [Streptomyces seoulensis]